ncbi:MAG TPA: hypothetical protein VFP50_18345 [Anaeromyxobacteraceae bacterium]|nr:hypothetical protein [Anaeromyxobacteraceae bacterium]
MTLRRALAALALAAALPAAAYVLPAPAVVKKAAEKRAALDLLSVEVTGTLELRGAALARLGALAPAAGGALTVPARILLKVPGRARVELLAAGAAEGERPFVALRDDRLTGQGGLEGTPAAAALVRGLAALLAAPTGGEGHALAEALVRRGVKLDDATLGRFNGRLAYVLGGRFVEGKRQPLAFVDKESFMPLRLLAAEGGAVLDVRLIDWASPTGGDWFPRAVEVWDGAQLLAKFTTEKAAANPKLSEALFER